MEEENFKMGQEDKLSKKYEEDYHKNLFKDRLFILP